MDTNDQEMKTNKYYTPSIEEFHVGFEYEMKQTFGDGTVKTQEQFDNTEWTKDVCTAGIVYIERMLHGKNAENGICGIRAKHLDREDIESLGFEIPQGGLDYIYKKVVGDIYYILITNPEYPTKIEIRCSHPSWAYGSFLGTIKNKSELKRVLTQIGVI